jgi:WD40 repeat protein
VSGVLAAPSATGAERRFGTPYVGLVPYTEEDAAFFFGRSEEKQIVAGNLRAARLTILYGPSGVGKTSLLQAGVVHDLREQVRENAGASPKRTPFAVCAFSAWLDEPLPALVEALRAAAAEALGGDELRPSAPGEPLVDTLRAWTQRVRTLLVVLDQFEDYFLYHAEEEGEGTFAVEFPRIVNEPNLRVNFLLSLREDAWAKLDRFEGQIPRLFTNYVRVEHLDRGAAREAIEGPVEEWNRRFAGERPYTIEPALVDAVIEAAAAGPLALAEGGDGAALDANHAESDAIEAPFLQLVLERLWRATTGARTSELTLNRLEQLGGAQRIVETHLQDALGALSNADQAVAADVFRYLVTRAKTKIAHPAADLAEWTNRPEPQVAAVLEKLCRGESGRILRRVPPAHENDAMRYEIFHDVLAEPVLAWKAGYETDRELERQKAESERRHRRLLRLLALAAVVLLIMAGVTIFALTQRGEARSQAKLARARELAATAVSQLQLDPEQSLSLAIESARLKRTSEAEDVLRQALIAAHERAILPSRGPVRTASFSPDGSRLLTASDDGAARIWRADGVLLGTFRHAAPVTAASFGPDGTLVLTAGEDGAARIWRTDTGKAIATIHHGGSVTSAMFSRDGRVVLTTSEDGTARISNAATGAPVVVVQHRRPVLSGSLSGDGRLLATVSSDRNGENLRVRLFALPRGRFLRELPAKGVTTISFNRARTLLGTGSEDHTAAIWRVSSGRRLHLFADHQGGVTDVAFGPAGRLLATTSSDGATRVWDTRTGTRVALMLGHMNAVNSASFSRDGRFLITASSDGTARVWEAATGRPEAVLRGHTDAVVEGTFSPNGTAVATASTDGTARIWDPGTAAELRVLASESKPVRAASFSHDNRLVLTASEDRTARILTADGRVLHVLRHPGPVASATFSPDGKRVLTDGADRTLRVWRTDTGALVGVVRNVSSGPLALSADGRLLAAPAASGAIRIWSAATFEPLRELKHGRPFTAASFSPDGRLLATAGEDTLTRIWDARTGTLLRTLRGHKDAVTSVQFSPDGKLLVTASRDHDARIWDVATGKTTELLRGHFGPIFGVSFSPDGRWVVTAGPVTAGLWQASNGRLLSYLRGHTQPLTSASFSPDGKWILTSSRDGTVRTYRCEVCGGIDELLGAATARLNALSRPLTAKERKRFLAGVTST